MLSNFFLFFKRGRGKWQKRGVARGGGGWTPNYIEHAAYQNIRNEKSKPLERVSGVLVDGCGQEGAEKGVWQLGRGQKRGVARGGLVTANFIRHVAYQNIRNEKS